MALFIRWTLSLLAAVGLAFVGAGCDREEGQGGGGGAPPPGRDVKPPQRPTPVPEEEPPRPLDPPPDRRAPAERPYHTPPPSGETRP